jgi:hypothetical protein
LTALPKWELLKSIHALVESFPSPQPLRFALLDHLRTISPSKFRPLLAELGLGSLEGEALINGLQGINESLSGAVRDRLQDTKGKATQGEADSACIAYVDFVNKWCADTRLNEETVSFHFLSFTCLPSFERSNLQFFPEPPSRFIRGAFPNLCSLASGVRLVAHKFASLHYHYL